MSKHKYYSKQYKENSHNEDPFLTKEIFFQGYNLTEELLPNIDFLDWIGLCYFERKLTTNEKIIIGKLPIAIASKGFRDPAILAALNVSIHKTPAQNALIASMGIAGGLYQGSKEVSVLMDGIQNNNKDITKIPLIVDELKNKDIEHYDNIDHKAGFIENHNERSKLIDDILDYFSNFEEMSTLKNYATHISSIENEVKATTSLSLILSLIFLDLKLSPLQAEHFYLFLLTPFISSMSVDQTKNEFKKFPFYPDIFKGDKE